MTRRAFSSLRRCSLLLLAGVCTLLVLAAPTSAVGPPNTDCFKIEFGRIQCTNWQSGNTYICTNTEEGWLCRLEAGGSPVEGEKEALGAWLDENSSTVPAMSPGSDYCSEHVHVGFDPCMCDTTRPS